MFENKKDLVNAAIITLSAEHIHNSKDCEGDKISFHIIKCLPFLHAVSQMMTVRINVKSEDNYDIYYIQHYH